MKDSQVLGFCHKKGIRLPPHWRGSYQSANERLSDESALRVRFHNRNETKAHFMAKAEVAWELMSRGQTVLTEIELPTRAGHFYPVCDLLWLDEMIVVEFEGNYSDEGAVRKRSQFPDFNVFVFNIKKETTGEILEKLGIKAIDGKAGP